MAPGGSPGPASRSLFDAMEGLPVAYGREATYLGRMHAPGLPPTVTAHRHGLGTPRRRAAVLLALPAGLVLVGCGDRDGPSLHTAATDSAGIRIVTHGTTLDEIPFFATLDSVAAPRIGSLSGDSPTQFTSVADVRELSDGALVVADGGAREVRIFERSGAHRLTFGGEGDGPGEFTRVSAVTVLPGDSIGVWDSRGNRLSVFSASGELGRSLNLGNVEGPRVRDLHLAGRGSMVTVTSRGAGGPVGEQDFRLERDTLVVRLLAAGGEELDTVGVFPGAEMLTQVSSAESDMVMVTSGPRPMARDMELAASEVGIAVGVTDRFEIRIHGPDGDLRSLLRLPSMGRAVGAAEREAWVEGLVAGASTEDPEALRRSARERLERLPPPDSVPAFGELRLTEEGRLWVQEYVLGPAEAVTWWAFDPDGRLLGRLEVPSGLAVQTFTDDAVLGVERDELDVPYVVRYPLRPVLPNSSFIPDAQGPDLISIIRQRADAIREPGISRLQGERAIPSPDSVPGHPRRGGSAAG